ncbi:MAG: hypothetical protein ACK44H_07990 [Candidatus Kryptonium sp.]
MRDEAIYVKLKKIYEDRTSGASILAGKLFSVLKEKALKARNRNEFLLFLKALKRDLKRHHPLLFQLQNLVDIILSLTKESIQRVSSVKRGDMVKIIDDIEERFKKASEKVADNFLRWLEAKRLSKVSIATLSYSGTVLNAVWHVKNKVSRVYVFRSCPKCEGDKMAKKLSDLGFNVFLVNDFGLDHVLGMVDFVVSGCDAVFKNGDILNKAGTSSIFKIARLAEKETLVLCDFSKFVRMKPVKNFKESSAVEKKGNVKTVDVIFEVVGSDFITGYITDVGIFINKSKDRNELVYSLSEMFSLWRNF